MTLYELTHDYMFLLEMMEDEDIDPQVINDTLEALGGAIEEKADNYAIILQTLSNNIMDLENEIQRLTKRKKSLESNVERMKNNLTYSMRTVGKTKFRTNRFSFSIQKNGGALPVKLKVNPDQLPTELQTITVKANNKAIADYINNTGDTTYAEFGERGESLRIR